MTLATFYPFSQTDFFRTYLGHLPWGQWTIVMVLAIGVLMLSHVLYPVVPKFSLHSIRGLVAVMAAVGSLIAAFTIPALFFFPAAVLYIAYGLVRTAVQGFEEQLPEVDPLIDEDEEELARDLDYEEIVVQPRHPSGLRREAE